MLAPVALIAWLLLYNRRRMHSALEYISPMQYEENWLAAKAHQAGSRSQLWDTESRGKVTKTSNPRSHIPDSLHDPRHRNFFLPQRTNIFAGLHTAIPYNRSVLVPSCFQKGLHHEKTVPEIRALVVLAAGSQRRRIRAAPGIAGVRNTR